MNKIQMFFLLNCCFFAFGQTVFSMDGEGEGPADSVYINMSSAEGFWDGSDTIHCDVGKIVCDIKFLPPSKRHGFEDVSIDSRGIRDIDII